MPDGLPVSSELLQATHSMVFGEPYNGIIYSNLQLYSNSGESTDLSDSLDPDCRIKPEVVASYWPGDIPGTQNTFASFYLDPEAAGDNPRVHVAELRQQLLGLQLSKTALRRYATSRANADLESDPRVDAITESVCQMRGAPAAAVILSRVLTHKTIRPGDQVAQLYFPSFVSNPRVALDAFRAAQQRVIDEEQL
jgi:hypothetical protein